MKRLTILLLLFFCIRLYSQDLNHELPSVMPECYSLLDELLSSKMKSYIKNLESVESMLEFHFTTGSYIRNNWLRHGNPELIRNINASNWNVGYDDISGVILNGYWYYLRGIEYEWNNELEAVSRFNNSRESPKVIPQNIQLQKTKNRYYYTYIFHSIKTREALHAYYEENSKDYYIYSLNFGWFILTEEEFNKFSEDPVIRSQLLESKEKFFIDE